MSYKTKMDWPEKKPVLVSARLPVKPFLLQQAKDYLGIDNDRDDDELTQLLVAIRLNLERGEPHLLSIRGVQSYLERCLDDWIIERRMVDLMTYIAPAGASRLLDVIEPSD